MSLKLASFILFSFGLAGVAQGQISYFPNETITVWKVGSPHSGETPDATVPLDLKLKAKTLGSTVRIEAFPAQGFAQVFFDAFERHEEPDIISFENAGILDGITTPLGGFTGIGSSKSVRRALIKVTGSLKTSQEKPEDGNI